MSVEYVLAALSHGHPWSETAQRTLDSFVEHVDELPVYSVFFHDGPGGVYVPVELADTSIEVHHSDGAQHGFCASTRALWNIASRAAVDRNVRHVFWLEHDFEILRPIRLHDLALVLRDASLAQVSLLRQPYPHEVPGIVPFEERTLAGPKSAIQWFAHSAYLTTNPSLMRAQFMRQNPWPKHETECEGKFGLELRERGYRFGAMGDGEPWVYHFGDRNGKGY